MDNNASQPIDYKTHILIGHASSGKMTVICHWPHVPRQDEVQKKIDGVQDTYAAFLLCTPTSIMPAKGTTSATGKQGSSRPFRPH